MVNRQKLHSVVNELREKLPPKYPVSVRIGAMPKSYSDCSGLTFKIGKRYIIYVKQSLNWDGAIDTLLHEWAHTLAWAGKVDHDPKWGIAFAKCWREIIDNSESEYEYGKEKSRRTRKVKRQRNGSSSKKSKR